MPIHQAVACHRCSRPTEYPTVVQGPYGGGLFDELTVLCLYCDLLLQGGAPEQFWDGMHFGACQCCGTALGAKGQGAGGLGKSVGESVLCRWCWKLYDTDKSAFWQMWVNPQ